MSDYSTLEARILKMLVDSGAVSFTSNLVAESLQRALDEYSQYNPNSAETLVELPGDGWEIALNNVADLLRVMAVHWPYDSTLAEDDQLTNRVTHFVLWWDDAQPVITIETEDNSMPELDDEVRIWYEKAHTIEGLGAGSVTSLPEHHESMLVTGAAGFAAMSKSAEMMLGTDTDMYGTTLVATWGSSKQKEFRAQLKLLARQVGYSGRQRKKWSLDKWDQVY
jgi:hypothetical protein